MKTPSLAVVVTLSVVWAGCGKRTSIPEPMLKSYAQETSALPRTLQARLHIAPTGITVTAPSIEAESSVEIGDVKAKAGARVGLAGAALFTRVTCETDDVCRFETKNGCEGTISRDREGDVVLITTGECARWAGKWVTDKPGSAASAAPPPCPVCPSAAPQVPCPNTPASPAPSGSAGPAPSGSAKVDHFDCTFDCHRTSMKCSRECKLGDRDCLMKCNEQTMECSKRCPPF